MASSPRAFVLRHTHLRPVPGLEEIRLHLADEVLPLWHAVQVETGDPDAALPYWAFAWAGGLAIGRYLREHPEAVAGRRVFDLASGSGLCAIAAMHAGAAEATGADIDAFAAAAIELNARANGHRVTVVRRDVLDDEPPDVDVILAGDCWYEARLAERVLPWLRRARRAASTSWSATPAAATCRPTSWSSSPRTTSARRPSSRTSSSSRPRLRPAAGRDRPRLSTLRCRVARASAWSGRQGESAPPSGRGGSIRTRPTLRDESTFSHAASQYVTRCPFVRRVRAKTSSRTVG